MREMWGEYWLFAHNGHLIDFSPSRVSTTMPSAQPIPNARSALSSTACAAALPPKPEPEVLFDAIAGLTHEIRRYGLFNFVMSNGDCLFAHASTLLHYIVRKAPFGKARLLDDDVMVDFSEVTTPNDKVSVIATLPLTRDETWSQLAVNELVMFQDGDIVRSDRPENPVYMSAEEGLEIARAVGVSV